MKAFIKSISIKDRCFKLLFLTNQSAHMKYLKPKKSTMINYISLLLLLFSTGVFAQGQATADGWISLFNGQNLDGWTIKIAKHPLNENFNNTFSVEDGVLKVAYDKYDKFDMQFGHIFTNLDYKNYIFSLEYKLSGTGMADAPTWTYYNSGVMIHAQSPQSMRVDQGFPVCIEAQILGVGATAGTQTGNAVTPGTHVEIDGDLVTKHIIDADAELSPLDTWVKFEIEVHGNGEIIHRIGGKEVIRYRRPQLDDSDKDAKYLLEQGIPRQLDHGYIALQAEGQAISFRDIRIKILEE